MGERTSAQRRGRRRAASLGLLLCLVGCGTTTPRDADGGLDAGALDSGSSDLDAGARSDAGSTDAGARDAGAADAQPAVDGGLDAGPVPPCDPGFAIEPPAAGASAFVVRFEHPSQGLTNIELLLSGPGTPTDTFEALESDSPPYRWRWRVTGFADGRLNLTVRADPDETEYGVCAIDVVGSGGCVPDCSDKLCGADDGCGAACAGSHRASAGGVNDCRLPGNCGCGVEPNDNMECTGSGECRIRCSCDCLPPQIRSAEAVRGLDHPASCELVFRESGDPTVWDSSTQTPLCPLGYDPQGAARCTECPPCHRGHPPSCEWSQWCTCRDPRWIEDYRSQCCANGECF